MVEFHYAVSDRRGGTWSKKVVVEGVAGCL